MTSISDVRYRTTSMRRSTALLARHDLGGLRSRCRCFPSIPDPWHGNSTCGSAARLALPHFLVCVRDVRGGRAREIACAGRRHCIVQHLERCRSRPHAWHPGSSRAAQPFRHGAYLHLPIGAVSVLGPHLGRPVRGQCLPQSATPRLPVERASDLPRRSTSRPSSAGAPAAAGLVIDGTPPCSQPWSHGWKPARWGQVCEIPPVTVEMLASQRNETRDC